MYWAGRSASANSSLVGEPGIRKIPSSRRFTWIATVAYEMAKGYHAMVAAGSLRGTREMPENTESRPTVALSELGSLIRAKRRAEGISLEVAARQAGVSAATLWRWERLHNESAAQPEPDRHKLAAVAQWLGVRVEVGTGAQRTAIPHDTLQDSGSDTAAMVEAHLRADPNLDRDAAAALARMFQVAYEQFARIPPRQDSDSGRQAEP